MAQFASDSFTGTAGAEISSSWTKRAVAAQKLILTAAGRARSDGPNPIEYYWNAGNPASADYSVSADIYIASTDSGVSAGVFARGATTATGGYFAALFAGTGLRLYKQNGAGSFTQLGSTYTVSLSAGTTRNIKIEVSGSATTTIKGYLDDALVITQTDSSSPHTAAGKAGVRLYDIVSGQADSKYLHFDNFSADDPVSGTTGTVAYTNANDTLAASGTTTITGSLAVTNANDICAAGSFVLDMDLLSEPLYFAHAGNKFMWPEESYTAFAASVAAGENFLDVDSQTLSTSEVVLMHDTTVNRTTNSTGNVSSKTLTNWTDGSVVIDPTGGAWFGGGYPDTETPPVLSDVLATYAGSALFSIEVKDSSVSALLTALSNGGIAGNQAVVSSFTSGHMATINASAYKSMFLTTAGAESAATVSGYGVNWVGVGTGTSSAQVSAYLGAGLKVAVWTLNTRKARDTWLGYGVNGIFSDDTKYLKATTALRTTDNFASQTWEHGMIASDELLTAASRGQLFSPDYWGYSSNETTFRGCLMGFLCPVANPSNFVLDFKVTFDSANGGDGTRWAGVFLGVDDNPFTNASGAEYGYAFLLRKNGEVSIWKKAPSGAAVSQGATSGSTIADGAEKTFRITVTATTVKIAQIDGSGNDVTEKTISDATYRGGYLSLSRNGLAAKFRDVSVYDGTGGTLATTNANDTLAASGSVGNPVTGSLAYTNANDTVAASGSTTVTGSLARANANDTVVASGSTTVVGSLATINANDTLAASGSTTVTGSLAVTNANDTLAASGSVGSSAVTGSLDYTNANDTLAASGTTTVTGSLAVTNANDTLSASGTSGLAQPIASTVERTAKFQRTKSVTVRFN
jgi:glycerophosphoryl diester phosphodiesterase